MGKEEGQEGQARNHDRLRPIQGTAVYTQSFLQIWLHTRTKVHFLVFVVHTV